MNLAVIFIVALAVYTILLGLALEIPWVYFEAALSFMLYLLPINALILGLTGLLAIVAPIELIPVEIWAGASFMIVNMAWLRRVYLWAWAKPQIEPNAAKLNARVGFMNILNANESYDQIGARIKELNMDVVGLAEVNFDSLKIIQKSSGFPYTQIHPRTNHPDKEELAVISRWPITNARLVGETRWDALEVELESPNIRLLIFHPYPPINQKLLPDQNRLNERNQAIAELPDLIQNDSTQPTIIVGDFNTAPWAPALTKMQQNFASHHLAGQGQGLYYTWEHKKYSWAWLPLDYIWLPNNLSSDLKLDRFMGSDHRLVWVEI